MARAMPIAAVAATLGTMTTANRFHLVPPRTWDSIFPPSRTYISGPDCPRSAAQSGRDGRSATSSGRRAPVLRGAKGAPTQAITPERQPLVAPEHFTHNLPDRLRSKAETPLSKEWRHCRRSYSVGTQENPLTRLAVGVREWTERRRSWSIHAAFRKGVRYWLVTAG
ncbi:hypothetical protein GCM10023080_008490 [Streptomyces pseudoechinosporeus]